MDTRYFVGIDIGGTFADCAVIDGSSGEVAVGKAPTTPDDYSRCFFSALEAAAEGIGLSASELLRQTTRLGHGTTVGTNALVARSGARVGLIATRGHGAAVFIADNASRGAGVPTEQLLHYPSSHALRPFVARADVREVNERLDRDGDVVVALDEEGVVTAAQSLVESGVESLAICFLWSFVDRRHELRALELVRERFPDVPVCASSEIAAHIGEYPRTATTILNAYISPAMRSYASAIDDRVRTLGLASPLMFMQADGGLATVEEIVRRPIDTLNSGPVGGVRAAAEYARAVDHRDVITTDVGGTTLDVSVITDGAVTTASSTIWQQHVLLLDHVDVQSVGAGGGSVAWIEEISGALRVGPQSVGADPGPACYGRGNRLPTVTDADVVIGFLDPERFFGGRLVLDRALAEEAIATVAEPLGMTVEQAAGAIHQVADAKMSDLMRSMTVRQGIDPRGYAVYGFGGGGGTHAGVYAQSLGCRELIIPRADIASVWSALGISVADLTQSFRQPVLMSEPFDVALAGRRLAELQARAEAYVQRIGAHAEEIEIRRHAACKYGMQVFEVVADIPSGEITSQSLAEMSADFERRYAATFGADAGYRQAGVVITAFVVEIVGRVAKPSFRGADVQERAAAPSKRRGDRAVYWSELGARAPTAVWDGAQLAPGDRVEGPAIVEYPHTTLVVRPDTRMGVDALGSVRITTVEAEVAVA